MFNILYVNPNIKHEEFEIFIKNNINNFNVIFMTSEYFLSLFSGLDDYLMSLFKLNECIGTLFNNAIYKLKSPISSNEFTNALIDYQIMNGAMNNNILSLIWHYDIQIFLLDTDRLNCIISERFIHHNDLLSNAIDNQKIFNIIRVVGNNICNYLLSNKDLSSFDSVLFAFSGTRFVNPDEIIKLTSGDIISPTNFKIDYSDLF